MSALTRGVPLNSSVSVGTSSVQALPTNGTRQWLNIQNVHASNKVGFTLDGTTPVINQQGTFVLTSGQGYVFDTFVPTGPLNVIGSGSATTVTIYSLE